MSLKKPLDGISKTRGRDSSLPLKMGGFSHDRLIKEFWLTGKDAAPIQVVEILRHLSEGSVGDAAAALAAEALAKCGSLESSSEIPWLLRKMAGRPVQDGDENLS